jgi:GT2 family glycosyltransferase
VVVVNWNGGALLSRCLEAVGAQSLPPSQVVVVDNGSADGSAETAARHPGATVLRLGANRGFAAAANAGVRAAEGAEWVALLNPDAFPEPDWLQRLAEAARGAPARTFFASRLLLAESEGRLDGTGDMYHASGLAWRRDHGRPAKRPRAAGEVFAACAAAALYPRAAFLDVGGFDESYFCYFEDVDLAFRLRLRGFRCWYVPDAVVRHVGGASAGRRSDFAVYHGHRNLVWTFVKDMPGPLLAAYLPLHVAVNAASLAWFGLRGQGRAIARAKWDALRGVPRAWRARREVQRTRSVDARELRRAFAGLLAYGRP